MYGFWIYYEPAKTHGICAIDHAVKFLGLVSSIIWHDQKGRRRNKSTVACTPTCTVDYSENASLNLHLSIPRTHTLSLPPLPPPLPPLLKGILDVYRYTLSQVEFYGPTNFSTFLDKAIEYATGGVSQEAQSYHILLIITVRKD